MQIIELYIRSQLLNTGFASSTLAFKLVSVTANFTETISVGDVVKNLTNNTTAKVLSVDSNTQLTLASNIMQSGGLYEIFSDYVKMDMFKDESLSISDSIQDVRDISKIFTTFSQQFNLPASKKNNKFFKHYQDTDVLNSFDARFKADAIIKLNGVDFRKGTIRLNTVDLKENKAYSYKVVFFGDIIELKDVMQDDDLSSLPFPDSLDFNYDNATVLSMFENTLDLDIAFPLVTHSKYFNIAFNGKYQFGNDKLIFTDLKPALKIKKIIEAIELKYNLTFSNDFFNSFNFKRIYMLLQRASGAVSNALTTGGILTVTNSLNDLTVTTANNLDLRPLSGGIYNFTYEITLSAATSVTVRITSPNGQVYSENTFNTAGTNTIQFELFGNIPSNIFFTVESENTLTISSQTLSVDRFTGTTATATYSFPSNSISDTFIVSRQVPQMKVIDFLTSLFKLYNLTAYKENGIIVVRSLQDYYNAGNTYNITEYVDVDKSSVGKLLQFKEIDFKFKSKKYFLVNASDEIQDDDFGNLTYRDENYDGGVYKVEVGFEKMMYERLSHNGALTTVIQGSLLDSNLEATIGAPLLMYCTNTNPNDAIDWGGTGNPTPTNYKRPSNAGIFINNTLNFGGEMDETTLAFNSKSLFQNNYINYITSIFDKQARKTKVTAYLPLKILLQYQLNDIFIIANKSYRINTIKTNLLTNKTDLELFNVFNSSIDLANDINSGLPRMANFSVTSKTSSTIDTSWTASTGAVIYWLYVDDVLADKTNNLNYQFRGLEANTTYKLSGQVQYASNKSLLTDIIITTT